jgi:hypothetical protein
MLAQTSLCAGLICCLVLGAAPLSAQQIAVNVNGEQVAFHGIGPQQIEGRVLVPVRGVLERLGADVEWVPLTQTVVASNGKLDITLKIGDRHAVVNSREVDLDVPAQVIAGTTFVPLRFLGEALGADVRWNGATQTVMIRTGDERRGAAPDVRDHDDRPQHALHRSGPDPVINSFIQDSRGWLRGGDTVHVVLEGTPGGQATFRIPGLAEETPMRETSPGHYQGMWQVPVDRPIQLPQATVIGGLKVGDRSSPLIQSQQPVSVDSVPPRLRDRLPGPDAHVDSPRPNISAVFDEDASGIDLASVRLVVDGHNVTPDATVTKDFISYTPTTPLPGGVQTVQLTAVDRAGNRVETSWRFIEDQREAEGIKAVRDNGDRTLQPGDVLRVEMEGTPGGKARFSLGNIKDVPLTERMPGRYGTDYTIRKGDDVRNSRIVVALTTPDGATFEHQSEHVVIVKTGKPVAPTVIYPAVNDAPTSPFVIKGKATANSQIRVKVDYRSKVLGVLPVQGTALDAVVQADRNGNWQTQPVALNGMLNNRNVEYTITATAISAVDEPSDPTVTHFRLR